MKFAHWEVMRITNATSRQMLVDSETGDLLWSSEFLWDNLSSLAEADACAETAEAEYAAKGWGVPKERYAN